MPTQAGAPLSMVERDLPPTVPTPPISPATTETTTPAAEQFITKSDMEGALRQEVTSRFRQASHTPFLVPPLNEVVGKLGVSPGSTDILEGRLDNVNTTPMVTKFLRQLKKPPNITPVKFVPTLEEYRRS